MPKMPIQDGTLGTYHWPSVALHQVQDQLYLWAILAELSTSTCVVLRELL